MNAADKEVLIEFQALVSELAANQQNGRDEPSLLRLADLLRIGKSEVATVQRIKRATILFTCNRLKMAPNEERTAFLYFLLRSETIDCWGELRMALYEAIETELNAPVGGLALEVSALLLRVAAPPSTTLAARIYPKLVRQYRQKPDWSHVGMLVALARRGVDGKYTAKDLLADVRLLARQPEFERNVKARGAVWASLGFALSSQEILGDQNSESREASEREGHAPDFTALGKSAGRAIAL